MTAVRTLLSFAVAALAIPFAIAAVLSAFAALFIVTSAIQVSGEEPPVQLLQMRAWLRGHCWRCHQDVIRRE
jgi:hypothetical protein